MRLDNKGFDSALDRSGAKFQSLGQVIGKGTKAASRVFAATTVAAVGLGAAALRVGLDYNRMQQTSRAALLTILGSTEAVNDQMSKLDEFASKSPFSKQVFLQAQQQMLGFGIETKKVIPYLDAIQNSVAAVGGSNEDISEIVNIFSKIQGSSKITAQNLNELGYRGLDAATLIGNAMGKTAEEIRSEISSGSLDAGAALDALAQGMTTKFGGATDKIKEQMDGAADRVKAAWRDIGSVMATPLIDPTSGGQLVEWTNLFADGLRQIQKQAGPVTDIIWGRLGPGIDFVTETMKRANAAIAGWDSKNLETSLDKIGAYAPLIAGTSAALFAMGTSSLPILSALGISGINPVVAGIAALVAFSPQLRAVGGDLLDALRPALVPAQELATIIGDFLMAAIDALAPALSALAVAGADVGVAFLNSLVPAVQGFATVALPIVDVVASLVASFAELPTPLLTAVAAFTAMKALGLGPVIAGGLKAVGAAAETAALSAMYMRDGTSGLSAAMAPLAGSITGVGTALKTAFVSNLPLLAITALVAAISAFANAKAEAKARIDEYKSSLDEATGATTENTKQLVANRMEQLGIHDMLDRLGVSYSDYAEAAIGNTEAQERLNERMAEGAKAVELMNEAYLTNDYSKITPEIELLAGAYTELDGVQKVFTDDIAEAQELHKRNAETMGIAASSADSYAESLRDAANAADRLRQAERDLAAAKGDLVAAQYATKDAQDEVNAAVEEHGALSRDQAGNIDTTTESYRAMDEAMLSQQRAMTSELDAMVKAGASQSELDAKRKEFLDTQRDSIAAWGHEGDEIDAYQDRLGGIPEVVSTKVEASTIKAQDDLNALLKQIQDSTGTMIIDGNQDPAVASLMESLGLVSNSEGVFSLDANNNPAIASLLLTLFDVDTSTGVMTIDGQNKEAIQKLRKTEAEINRSDGTVTILGRNRTQPVLTEVKGNINSASGHVKVYASDKTYTTVSNIIAGINGRSAYISVRTVSASGQGMGRTLANADGSVIDYYAHGGLREHRVAQIAPAGAWRIWAEEETGGEAYIPLAPAKRARSLAILDEVARRFDRVTIPRNPMTYADGGLRGSSPGGVVNNFKAQRIGAGMPEVLILRVEDGPTLRAYVEDTARTAVGATGSFRSRFGVGV